MTQRQYIEYLVATTDNYTCSNLAAHLEGDAIQSHDAVCDFLSGQKLTPRGLWTVAQGVLNDGPDSYLILNDSVVPSASAAKPVLQEIISPVVAWCG